jgi:uncharacterized protein YjiS (DUF1127 family)
MVRGGTDHPDTVGLYEIGLDGDVCDAMRRANPEAQVAAAKTSTVLWSRVQRRRELHALLDSLADFGLTPHEIHESGRETHSDRQSWPGRANPVGLRSLYCEVRIGGWLGDAALHHLGWSHCVVQTTVVTVQVTRASLGDLLAQMSTLTRVDYVVSLRG